MAIVLKEQTSAPLILLLLIFTIYVIYFLSKVVSEREQSAQVGGGALLC